MVDEWATREVKNPSHQSDRFYQEDISQSADGTIAIKNGKVIVTAPRGFGRFPILYAGENVDIYINGKKIESPTIVNNDDQVEIRTKDTLPSIDLAVELTADKMKAYLVVKRIQGIKFVIPDCPPLTELKVTAKVVEKIDPPPLHFQQIIDFLKDNGIVYGVDQEAIYRVLDDQQEVCKVEIARGLLPSGMEDAAIFYTFPTQSTAKRPANPYGEGKITSVLAGEILAIKKPPKDGIPGIDVTGKPVLPRAPKDEPILAGDGVKLIKDDTVAVAAISGRPVLEGVEHRYLSVRPSYVVYGDVDVKVGNLKFNGDIIVRGSVLDGFRLEAAGDIEIFGDVLRSEVLAGGNILIHGKAITANIQAGGRVSYYQRLLPLLSALQQRLQELCAAIELLKKQPAFSVADLGQRGEGTLVQLLLDYKFKDIPAAIGKLNTVLQGMEKEIAPEIQGIGELLTRKLCNLGPLRIRHTSELTTLLGQLQKAMEMADYFMVKTSHITVNYVQNSFLQASGDIVINGPGSVVSVLQAGNRVVVEQGTVRGGQISAGDKIMVRELGSKGITVRVKLLNQCQLNADYVHPFVVLQYGVHTKVIEKGVEGLTAKIEQDGSLTVHVRNHSPRRAQGLKRSGQVDAVGD